MRSSLQILRRSLLHPSFHPIERTERSLETSMPLPDKQAMIRFHSLRCLLISLLRLLRRGTRRACIRRLELERFQTSREFQPLTKHRRSLRFISELTNYLWKSLWRRSWNTCSLRVCYQNRTSKGTRFAKFPIYRGILVGASEIIRTASTQARR